MAVPGAGFVPSRSAVLSPRPEDTIGRGGRPLLPAVVAVDVVYPASDGASACAQRIHVVSGRLARAGTRSGVGLHQYSIGTFVDVVHIARDASTGQVASHWRWAEVVDCRPDHILVRYCTNAEVALNPSEPASEVHASHCVPEALLKEEWISMSSQAYRVRPHGEMTDVLSEEQACCMC